MRRAFRMDISSCGVSIGGGYRAGASPWAFVPGYSRPVDVPDGARWYGRKVERELRDKAEILLTPLEARDYRMRGRRYRWVGADGSPSTGVCDNGS